MFSIPVYYILFLVHLAFSYVIIILSVFCLSSSSSLLLLSVDSKIRDGILRKLKCLFHIQDDI